MLCVPTPAVAGLKIAVPFPLSVIPGPLNVPPAWLPVSVDVALEVQ